jgi:SAM-dependent methyltransferase
MPDDRNQRKVYETAYADTDERFGFPDPKILNGWTPPEGARVLSVGAGAGRDIWHLTSVGHVHAVDFASSGLSIAARHGLLAVSADVARGLPYRDGCFDLVILKDLLEHIVDPEGLTREAIRVLRSDGRVIISVPNHFYLPFRLRLLIGKGMIWKSVGHDHSAQFEEWNYMHLRFFTFSGFRRFIDVVGLAPEQFYWDFGTLAHYNQPEMIFGAQLEKRRRGLPLSSRGRLGLALLYPAYRLLNRVFPKGLRHAAVSCAPGLLCAGFYVRCHLRPPS